MIREQVTMPKLLAAYGIDPGRQTRGWRRIPCPIHNGSDKNFSFSDEAYKCFVCGAKGGVIHFAEEYRHLSFPDALREIDALCGLRIPFDEHTEPEINRTLRKVSLNVYAQQLRAGIERRLNADYTAAMERLAESDRSGAPDAAEAYGRMMDAQEALFRWEAYGRERLREYSEYVLNDLETDSDGRRVFDSRKRRILEDAAAKWSTGNVETGHIPCETYFPNVNFNNKSIQ